MSWGLFRELDGLLSVVYEIRTGDQEELFVARDLRISFEARVVPKLYWWQEAEGLLNCVIITYKRWRTQVWPAFY
jgi:hypothetical protein